MFFNFGVWFSIVCAYSKETQTEIFRHFISALDESVSMDYDEGRVTHFKKCKENLPKRNRTRTSKSIIELMDAKDFMSFSDDFFSTGVSYSEDNIKNILFEIAVAIINDESISESQILIGNCSYVTDCKENTCKTKDFLYDCFRIFKFPTDALKMQRMIFGSLQFAYSRQNKIDNNVYTVNKSTSPSIRFGVLYKKQYQKSIPNNFYDYYSLDFAISEEMQKAYNKINDVLNTAYPFYQGRFALLADEGVGESKVAEMYAKINSKRFRSGVFLGGCQKGQAILDSRIKDFIFNANFEILESVDLYTMFLRYYDEKDSDGKYKRSKWLIVFDDVNDEQMYQHVSTLLPKNPYGSILFTSNDDGLDWNKIAGENILRLNCPSEKTSMRDLILVIDSLFRDIVIPINLSEKEEAEEVCTTIVNHLAYNPRYVRYVARHLFNEYVKSYVGEIYSEYYKKYGEETYFRYIDTHNEKRALSIVPTLRKFVEKLDVGRPIALNYINEDGTNLQIFKDDGVYKLDTVDGR